MLKTIRIAVDESLLEQIDSASAMLGLSRSAFIREVLRQVVEQNRVAQLERRHATGYAGRPVELGEFDVWSAEQAWGEAQGERPRADGCGPSRLRAGPAE